MCATSVCLALTGEPSVATYTSWMLAGLPGARDRGGTRAGGAYDYLVNGRMIGGFAVIAWPVKYDDSGVMTFMVNQDGVVYERDLGPDTEAKAAAIATFNPDKSWDKADATPP